jgi:hypothetical protein
MATAALLPSESATRESQSVSAPRTTAIWWRRGHSYAFAALVVLEILALWLGARLVLLAANVWMSNIWIELISAAGAALLLGQVFLLGLWAALGGLATIPRWSLVGVAAGAGVISLLLGVRFADDTSFTDSAPVITFIAWSLVYSIAALLVPLRRLAGWRVDFDPAYHPPGKVRRGQMHLMDFVAMSCAVALPLTFCRMLMEFQPEDTTAVPIFLGVAALVVTFACGPAAYAALATRRLWLWGPAACGWTLVLIYGLSMLAMIDPDLVVFGGAGTVLGMNVGLAVCVAGMTVSVAGPLLVLRRFGLRLLRVE